MISIILDDVTAFFQALNDAPTENFTNSAATASEIWTGRILNAEGKDIVPGLGTIRGTTDELIAIAEQEYETARGTLHVIPNRVSDRGSRSSDVQSPRALLVDIDSETETETIRALIADYSPIMVVESSPKKYHVYWRVDATMPLPVWEDLQLGLAHKFRGDKNLAQRAHSIRVPGIPRITKTGEVFTPRVVYLADLETAPTYGFSEIIELFPDLNDAILQAKQEKKEHVKTIKSSLKKGGKLTKKAEASLQHSRNRAVFDWVEQQTLNAKNPLTVTEEEALAWGHEVAQILKQIPKDHPLTQREIDEAAKNGRQYAQIIAESRQSEAAQRQHEITTLLTTAPTVGGYVNGSGTHNGSVPPHFDSRLIELNKFTETAVAEKMIRNHVKEMVWSGDQLYAFNNDSKTWRPQTADSHREIFTFSQEAVMETLADPDFISTLCIDAKGNYSEYTKRKEQERFLKFALPGGCYKYATHSLKVKEIPVDILDSVPHLLFAAGKVVDLRTGSTREPRPEDYMLNSTDVPYVPDAKCDWWEEFIGEVFAENTDPAGMVEFMQELFGYSLSGSLDAQKVFCHYGDGCNGKSKVLWALKTICGDYGTIVDHDDVVSKKGAQTKAMERIGAKIEGHRVVIIDDISLKTVWNEGTLKTLTGKLIRARAEHQQSRVFANRCTLHMGFNEAPNPEGENEGIIRRLCIIYYPKKFKQDDKMSNFIDQQIEAEKEGILAWAVRGAQRWWAKQGFIYPAELEHSVELYKEENFTHENVLTEILEIDPEIDPESAGGLFASEILDGVNQYMRDSGINEMLSIYQLGRAIKRKFRITATKKWSSEKKNMFSCYRLKFKFERPKSMFNL